MQEASLFQEHNEMSFYTWGDENCCLPKGATEATLLGTFEKLQPGDVLIFEEIVGPQTGNPADADVRHRCAVRLTAVATQDAQGNPLVDPLFEDVTGAPITSAGQKPTPVTEIQWAESDALPFPVCLSSKFIDSQQKEQIVPKVSIVLGNNLIADHGVTLTGIDLGRVPRPKLFRPPNPAGDRCHPTTAVPLPVRYQPDMPDSPITQAVTLQVAGSPITSGVVHLATNSYVTLDDANGLETGLELTVGQNLRVDSTLQVGSVETQVTVGAEAPLVDTTSATLSGLIDDRRVVDLPLNGRNIMSLARILPGVLNVNAPQTMGDARGGPEMDVNGGRPNMNLFTFNGGYFNNPSRNTGINFPPPDAIQEVRIQTHNFSAEYGRNPGSQVNVVSKTGTNEIHGAAWEFLRNNALNARNFFSPEVPALKQNQFGVAAGGPIKKDKLFVFGTYEGLRDHRQAQTRESFLPSAAERAGDFTALGTTLTDPVDPLTNKPLTDSAGNSCVSNNKIAAGCISPVATNLLQYVPQTPSNTLVALASQPRVSDLFMTRGDWNQSEKHRVFGSFYYVDNSLNSPGLSSGGTIPGYMSESIVTNTRNVVVNDIYTFSPTLINQATFSFLNSGSNQLQGKKIDPSTLGY